MDKVRPQLLIRSDASTRLGTGHVMRMIALAQAWRRRGGETRFFCCQCPKGVRYRVTEAGFGVQMVDANPGSKEDLSALLNEIKGIPNARVALDNYHFDFNYQSAVREAASRLLVVDDYGHLDRYNADVLLNQNPSAEKLNLVARAPGANILVGTKFALLREEFLQTRPLEKPAPDGPLNLLVTLGGGDPDNVTQKVLEALLPLASHIAELHVIVGAANPNLSALRALLVSAPFPARIIENARDMPAQIAWADAAITAGGSTCWELAAFGVPMAIIVLAENQLEIAATLHNQLGLANLGWQGDATISSICGPVEHLLTDTKFRNRCHTKLLGLVDARGADRVAAALEGSLHITIATAPSTWMNDHIDQFVEDMVNAGHEVHLVHSPTEIPKSDLTFLLSFESLVKRKILNRSTHTLVVHASALPEGRGWSPLTWQILEGKNKIPLTLFEAEDSVDSGAIYFQEILHFEGHELINEMRAEMAKVILSLCRKFVNEYPGIAATGRHQSGTPTFYQKRGAEESRLDLDLPLRAQFDLLRTTDNDAYPAFFEHRGHRYDLRISKHASSETNSEEK